MRRVPVLWPRTSLRNIVVDPLWRTKYAARTSGQRRALVSCPNTTSGVPWYARSRGPLKVPRQVVVSGCPQCRSTITLFLMWCRHLLRCQSGVAGVCVVAFSATITSSPALPRPGRPLRHRQPGPVPATASVGGHGPGHNPPLQTHHGILCV